MGDEAKKDERWDPRDRWRPGEPLPWAKWHWRDWLSKPVIRRLTYEERGRFLDVWCATQGTPTPGVMTEEDVRLWAGYEPGEWRQHRDAFARVFNITRQKGKWRLDDVIEGHKAALEALRTAQIRARKGVEARAQKRRSGNEITTRGEPEVPPVVDQIPDTRSQRAEIQRTDVPDGKTAAHSAVGLASSGTGGTTAVSNLLERALSAGCASGTSGTDGTGGTPPGGGGGA